MHAHWPWLSLASCTYLFWIGSYLDRQRTAKGGGIQRYQPVETPVNTSTLAAPAGILDRNQELFARLASQRAALAHAAATLDAPSQEAPSLLQQVCADLRTALRLHDEVTSTVHSLREASDGTSLRTDPVTGLGNEFTMNEWLRMMFGLMLRYGRIFSLAIVEMDGHSPAQSDHADPAANAALCDIAGVVVDSVRETDFVFRLPNHQLAIALPETDLKGTQIFAQRLQASITDSLGLSVCIGVSAARDDDNSQSLIKRVQAAVFAAKSSGGNSVFRHTGHRIEAARLETLYL